MLISDFVLHELAHELRRALGSDRVTTDKPQRQEHATDWSWTARLLEYRDVDRPMCDVLVRPATADGVAEVIRIAYDFNVPVVPRGGGSGTQGGTLAQYGGIALDLRDLNAIISIDDNALTVTAEAGIDGKVLETTLNERGLTLPHYPGSASRGATLGGYLAARGAGVSSTKYGKAEDLVMSVQAAVPPGKLISTLPTRNHAAGPDLMQLLVGSEGTLGAITQATMQIVRLPESRAFATYTFDNLADGIDGCAEIMRAGLRPAVIRLYDQAGTNYLARTVDVPDSRILLLFVFEGQASVMQAELEAAHDILNDRGAKSLGSAPAETWWNGRENPHSQSNAPGVPLLYGTTDVVASFAALPLIYSERKQLIEDEYSHWGARYTAHFSHWYPWGGMIYDRFYIDNPPTDVEQALELHDEIWDRMTDIALRHGASLNDHHGIGIKLGRFMRTQMGPAFDVMTSIKQAIDPKGLMNPGKLGFPRP